MHGRYANSMDFKIEFNQLAMTIDQGTCTHILDALAALFFWVDIGPSFGRIWFFFEGVTS